MDHTVHRYDAFVERCPFVRDDLRDLYAYYSGTRAFSVPVGTLVPRLVHRTAESTSFR
jgi:hypothetical protein